MNDRYLFRAKRIDNGEWIIGIPITFESFTYIMEVKNTCMCKSIYGEDCGDCVDFNMRAYRVDPSTICQCTGLKDKHGKLILENDIVWDSEEREFYQIIFSQEDMCYYMQDADGYKDVFEACYGSSIEVESNIFDNPELMHE